MSRLADEGNTMGSSNDFSFAPGARFVKGKVIDVLGESIADTDGRNGYASVPSLNDTVTNNSAKALFTTAGRGKAIKLSDESYARANRILGDRSVSHLPTVEHPVNEVSGDGRMAYGSV